MTIVIMGNDTVVAFPQIADSLANKNLVYDL